MGHTTPTDSTPTVTRERVGEVRARLGQQIVDTSQELGVDPLGLAIADMTGIDYYQRWLGGDLAPPPPWALVFAMEWLEVEPSRAVASLEPAEWMFNQVGTVHGGVAATLLDTALGAAVHSGLPARTGFATTDLHVRYIRPIMANTGRVIATATAVHTGRRQATAEGRIEAEATGKLIATATAAWTIFEIPS
jgi:uncharacterized protein (TIGR00369 family)